MKPLQWKSTQEVLSRVSKLLKTGIKVGSHWFRPKENSSDLRRRSINLKARWSPQADTEATQNLAQLYKAEKSVDIGEANSTNYIGIEQNRL